MIYTLFILALAIANLSRFFAEYPEHKDREVRNNLILFVDFRVAHSIWSLSAVLETSVEDGSPCQGD